MNWTVFTDTINFPDFLLHCSVCKTVHPCIGKWLAILLKDSKNALFH